MDMGANLCEPGRHDYLVRELLDGQVYSQKERAVWT